MFAFCTGVLLPPMNPNIICESKKLSLKNSSYVVKDNIFFHWSRWKNVYLILKMHIGNVWNVYAGIMCSYLLYDRYSLMKKKLHTLSIWFQVLPDIWCLYTANW